MVEREGDVCVWVSVAGGLGWQCLAIFALFQAAVAFRFLVIARKKPVAVTKKGGFVGRDEED